MSLALALCSPASAMMRRAPPRQAVVVTDPVLATSILRSRHLDKLRFQYSFLDPVRARSDQ